LPLSLGERPRFSQDVLGNADLAQVVKARGLRNRLSGRPRQVQVQRELTGQLSHACRVSTRARILRLEGVGQTEQTLEDGALKAPIRPLQIERVLQRLLIAVAQSFVRLAQLLFPGSGGFVRALQITGVGQRLGQRYFGHVGTSGTSDRTSLSSASGE